MKKLFALVLSLCMLCGCAAFAETAISWEDVNPILEATGISGDFYTFDEIAVMIWIPEGMVPVETSDDTCIGYFTSEDGSGDAVSLSYVNVEGMDLETLASILPDHGAYEIETGTVNGLPCVTYSLDQEDGNKSACIAFTTDLGYVLEVVCAPANTEEEQLGCSVILSSIQPYAE